MNSKPIFWIFWLLAYAQPVQPQTLRSYWSSIYTGAGAYTVNKTDVFSFLSNQASLSKIKNFSAGVFGERKYLLPELTNYRLAIALPTKKGNFGLTASNGGSPEYKETEFGFAYARNLGAYAAIGIQFNYYSINIQGYGSANSLNVDVGCIFHPTEKLSTGFHIHNPFSSRLGKSGNEKLPALYEAGMGYEISDRFFTTIEIKKEENFPVDVNICMQYRPVSSLLVRTGISTAAPELYAGAGFMLGALRLDVTSAFHPRLGVSPGLLLIYTINKEK